MACRTCAARSKMAALPAAVLTSNIAVRYISVRCINCTGVMQLSSGIIVPLVTGEFFSLPATDIVRWLRDGYIFEYANPEDAAYISENFS